MQRFSVRVSTRRSSASSWLVEGLQPLARLQGIEASADCELARQYIFRLQAN
jgi:hypothetical protein